MKNLEWTFDDIDKSAWGNGPWLNEPDKVQWVDEDTGLACMAKRHPRYGHWCGYVGLPPEHPAHGKHYDDPFLENIFIHGGITYSEFYADDDEITGICRFLPEPNDPDPLWWFGFDCAHLGDLSPGVPDMGLNRFQEPVYRDLEFVRRSCSKLAQQLLRRRIKGR